MRKSNYHLKITITLIQIILPNCTMLHASKQGVCSAEVGPLTSVFEKSASELKPKQNLLRCKSIVNIVAFDRTLNSINQLPELTASVAEHDMCTNHRYYHSELELKYHDTGNGWTFVLVSPWKNCQCCHTYRNTSQSLCLKITKYHRENSTENDVSLI